MHCINVIPGGLRVGLDRGHDIDFFAENALEHERTGEMIENFLEGLDLPVDPNMINQPRMNAFSVPTTGTSRSRSGWRYKAGKSA